MITFMPKPLYGTLFSLYVISAIHQLSISFKWDSGLLCVTYHVTTEPFLFSSYFLLPSPFPNTYWLLAQTLFCFKYLAKRIRFFPDYVSPIIFYGMRIILSRIYRISLGHNIRWLAAYLKVYFCSLGECILVWYFFHWISSCYSAAVISWKMLSRILIICQFLSLEWGLVFFCLEILIFWLVKVILPRPVVEAFIM